MSTTAVSVSQKTMRVLNDLANETSQSVEQILEKAIEDYRRKVFFEGLAADYAALKSNPESWTEELEERKLFEGTLMDDLDPNERWSAEGHALPDAGEPT